MNTEEQSEKNFEKQMMQSLEQTLVVSFESLQRNIRTELAHLNDWERIFSGNLDSEALRNRQLDSIQQIKKRCIGYFEDCERETNATGMCLKLFSTAQDYAQSTNATSPSNPTPTDESEQR